MTDREHSNDWLEYKKLILYEFRHINSQIDKLLQSREEDTEKARIELKQTVSESEKRICDKVEKMEERQLAQLQKLEEKVSENTNQITSLRIKAAAWGAGAGSIAAAALEIIKILVEKFAI